MIPDISGHLCNHNGSVSPFSSMEFSISGFAIEQAYPEIIRLFPKLVQTLRVPYLYNDTDHVFATSGPPLDRFEIWSYTK